MKTVYAGHELPHVWAHQTVPYGRGGNVSFDGTDYKSYAATIGRLILRRGKPDAVLLDTRNWSQTTNRHQSDIRRATSHLKQFKVPLSLGRRADVLADYKRRIMAAAELVARARSNKTWRIEQLQALVAEANEYAEYFGLKTRFTADIDLEAERKKAADIERRRDAKYAKIRAERMQLAREMYPVDLAAYNRRVEAWRRGELVHIGFKPADPDDKNARIWNSPIYLRSAADGRIETSQGAVVPAESARRVLAMVRRQVEQADCPPYGVVQFDGNTVTIGCHKIGVDEIERLAAELGW